MNKNIKRKAIISSLLIIVLCLSLLTGATFAIFTSESKVNISVSSGKVELLATVDTESVYTKSLNEEYQSGTEHFYEGAASLIDNKLTLDNLVPGDAIKFNIIIKNNSTASIKYRTVIEKIDDNGLFAGLTVKIDNSKYRGNKIVSNYKMLEVNSNDFVITVEIELPEEAGNSYQGKKCEIAYVVEAIQGNAETVDADQSIYYIYTAKDLVNLKNKAVYAKEVYLMNDIDMTNVTYSAWSLVLPAKTTFTFYGNGHTIKNLKPSGYVGEADNEFQSSALFARVDSQIHAQGDVATFIVQDLIIDSANVSQSEGINPVAAALIGVSNVVNVEIKNCDVINSVITSNKYAGGFIGYMQQSYNYILSTINDSTSSNNEITGNGNTAGIIALTNYEVDMCNITVKDNEINGQNGHSAAALAGAGKVVSAYITCENNTYSGGGKCENDVTDSVYGTTHDDENFKVNNTNNKDDVNKILYITDLEDLKAFRDEVNAGDSYNGWSIYLLTDINLNNENWEPIGNEENPFMGRLFDGKDHTISNLKCNGGVENPIDLEATCQGLFGKTYTNGNIVEIGNLNFHNVDIYAKNSAGSLIGCIDTAQSVFWSAGYTGIHNIDITGKVTIEGGNSGGIAGSPVAHWALQTGFSRININVEEGSYLSNVKARELSGDGVGGALGGVVAIAAWDRGSTEITSNLDVYGVSGNVGGIVGVGNQVWYQINYTGNVTITGVTKNENGKYNYGLAVGGFAPVWHHYDMSDARRATVIATGDLKIILTDGTVVTTNGQKSDAIGGFFW